MQRRRLVELPTPRILEQSFGPPPQKKEIRFSEGSLYFPKALCSR